MDRSPGGEAPYTPFFDCKVRFQFGIDTLGEMVRLTVTHDELTADLQRKITYGWLRVLSSLKSFLETGHPVDTYA